MSWSTKPPKKQGWYLVTTKDGTVMPGYRQEFPPGNFTWLRCTDVIASVKFPKAHTPKEDKK